MADGEVRFRTKLDNANLEKDLADAKKKIDKAMDDIQKYENAKLPLTRQVKEYSKQLDEAKEKLKQLQKEHSKAQQPILAATVPNPDGSYTPKKVDPADAEALRKATAAVADQKAEVADLQKKWEDAQASVADYDKKISDANSTVETQTARAQELVKEMNSFGYKASQAMEKAKASAEKFGKKLLSISASVLVFNAIRSGMRSVVDYTKKLLSTNDEYKAQLAQLKGALMTAFQPIYNYVLPGVIAVLKVLTAIVSVVAKVMASLFGTTVQDSAKAAESLNKEADAISGVGSAAEEAQKQLMGFDEINQLQETDTSTSGGGGGGSGTTDIAPDFSWMDDVSERLEKIAKWVLLIAAGFALWKIGESIGGKLGDILSKLGLVLAAVGGIALAIDGITDAWENGVDWGNMAEIITGVAIAAGALYLAFGNIAAGITLIVGGAAMIVTAFHDMMENGMNLQNTLLLIAGTLAAGLGISILVGSWIPLVIAAIASVLAAIVYFTGHGSELIDGLKKIFSGLIDFIAGLFTADWERCWNGLKDTVVGFGEAIWIIILSLIDGIKAVANWVSGLFGGGNSSSTTGGGGSGRVGTYSMPQTQIPVPALARGAVLPANKPFLAMVGDQKNGTNVEAPLATIKQAMAEVLAQNGGGEFHVTVSFEGTEAQLIRYLSPKITVQQRKEARAKGV